VKYVSKILGKKAVRAFLEKNKGKSVLDMLSMSDIAYCVVVVKNQHEVWDQEFEIKKVVPDKQRKYTAKVAKTLSIEDRLRYIKNQPLFTSRISKKMKYLDHG